MRKITIRDIAAELGISKGTVDRAIHNRPDVNPETRARVLALIEKYQYKPDPIARSLSLRAKPVRIGLIFPENPHFFWDRVDEGAREAASELADFNLELLVRRVPDRLSSFEKSVDGLLAEGIEALAFVPREHSCIREIVAHLQAINLPFSTLNDDLDNSGRLFYIGPQMGQSGRVAAELTGRFLPNGGKVILIADPISSKEYAARIAGFQEKLSEDFPAVDLIQTFSLRKDSKTAISELEEKLRAFLADGFPIAGIYDSSSSLLPTLAKLKSEISSLSKTFLIGHELSTESEAYLRQNLITACISQDPFSQGYMTVRNLFRYLNAETLPPYETMYSRVDIFTKENLIDPEHRLDYYVQKH